VSLYEFLLFVHVSFAVIWIGGNFVFQVYAMVVERDGDADEVARFVRRAGVIGERLFAPSAIIVLLAGIGLMLEGNWDWGTLWVVFALVAFAASFIVGIAVLSPLAKKLELVGAATPEGQDLGRRIFAILRVDLLFLFAIVFAMTVKPTLDDLGVVLGAAAVIVVLSVVFLARSRPDTAEEASPKPAA
jgi:uncharacterized membrane protein